LPTESSYSSALESARSFLQSKEAIYYSLLEDCHYQATKRGNASSTIIHSLMSIGARPKDIITAALQTLDTAHAPIQQTRIELYTGISWLKAKSKTGIIYGFGSSFYKKEPDPLLANLHQFVMDNYEHEYALIQQIQDILHSQERILYPNLSLYTAVYCERARIGIGGELG